MEIKTEITFFKIDSIMYVLRVITDFLNLSFKDGFFVFEIDSFRYYFKIYICNSDWVLN